MEEKNNMNKSFENLSKLTLGATLVASAFMGSTDSASTSQTATSENLNVPTTQLIQTTEDTVNPMLRANHVALDAPLSNNGNYWHQPGGYKYFRLNINNTSTDTLKVYILEDGYSNYWGTVPAKSSKTFVSIPLTVLPGNGKLFGLSYASSTGIVSGTATVRVSTTPF
ncbi:hypothetical protein [Sporosarcina sp. NPDC096371]|uniref:hypothetical protein n=1 Tax=Sporosarcina sp. NPDC096371 TaxID=3364530 RepID=UPI003827A8C6